ncbi:hypothetical protein BKA69DRAFT_634683 [Paraphysoderma sedebokerense]|nr:hypothetical protein BKA69DRAFT_634683 [Paraphysoderma sedebokerense]
MLPLLVRPLVNYADQVINKEKMPNLIVGVSDEVGSGKTWSYLMGAVDYIVRGFHFKTDAAKSLSRSDLRPGPKAVIVLPTKDAVIRMRKLIGDICEALSQQRHSNGNNNFGVRSSPLVVTYLAIISRIQNAQLLKYINSHDIVIATPALLRELVDRNQLSLAHVRFFVVDEVPHSTVDPSVDPNYALDVAKLVSRLPPVTKYHNIKLLLLAREFNESTQYLVTKVAESYKISVPSNGLHGGRISCCQGFIKLETVRQKAEFVPPVVLRKLCDRIPCYVDAEVQQQFILYDDSDRKLNTLVDLIEKPSHADHIGFVVLTRDKSCANQLSIAIQTLTKRKVFLSRCEHLANITGDIRLEVQQNLSKNDFRPVVIIMEMPDNPAELFNVNFNKICYDLSWHVVNYNCPKSYDDFVARSLCVVGPKCFAIGDNHLRLSLRRDIAHQLKPVTVHTFFREMEYSLILDYNRRFSTHK